MMEIVLNIQKKTAVEIFNRDGRLLDSEAHKREVIQDIIHNKYVIRAYYQIPNRIWVFKNDPVSISDQHYEYFMEISESGEETKLTIPKVESWI